MDGETEYVLLKVDCILEFILASYVTYISDSRELIVKKRKIKKKKKKNVRGEGKLRTRIEKSIKRELSGRASRDVEGGKWGLHFM